MLIKHHVLWNITETSKKARKLTFLFFYFLYQANLFNIWLNRKPLDSHTCSCSPSVTISYFGWSIWRKTSVEHICHWTREDYFNKAISIKLWIFFSNTTPNSTSGSALKVRWRGILNHINELSLLCALIKISEKALWEPLV